MNKTQRIKDLEVELNEVETMPLHRGAWVKCSDEMPTVEGVYIVHVIADSLMREKTFRNEEWQSNHNVTHWLKLHPLPPLPEPEKKDEFEEWFFSIHTQAQYNIDTYNKQKESWHAALVSREKGKV